MRVKKTIVLMVAMMLSGAGAWASGTVIAGNALPINGQVVAGSATISSPNANTLNVQQTSNRAVINWDSFNVGAQATVNFHQPNAAAVVVNRVVTASPSQIDGALNANGTVVLINSAGVVIGRGAQVNTGALVAATLDINNDDFMNGIMRFVGAKTSTSKIVNYGNVNATADNGFIALLAPEVRNEGYLVATKSSANTVAMASGSDITLNINGMGLTGLRVNESVYNGLVENRHVVETNGGLIIIAAGAASNLLGSVIKNTGTLAANSIVNKGGEVFLQASSVINAGQIGASGNNGGLITLLGNGIELNAGSVLRANSLAGNAGVINIGSSTSSVAPVASFAAANGSSGLASSVTLDPSSSIMASASVSGNGGAINILSTAKTVIGGLIEAVGAGSGNGGSVVTGSQGIVQVLADTVVNVASGLSGRLAGTWMLAAPSGFSVDLNAANAISNTLEAGNVQIVSGTLACAAFSGCASPATGEVSVLSDITKSGSIATSLSVSTSGLFNSAGNISGAFDSPFSVAIKASSVTIEVTSNINASNTTIDSIKEIDIYGNVIGTGQNPFAHLIGASVNISGGFGSRRQGSNGQSSQGGGSRLMPIP